MKSLGFAASTSRTHIGFMGCHGGFNALRVAKAYAEADPEATVLIVCVELCSLHFQYTDNPEQIVANSIFSDGAAAIVVDQQTMRNQVRLLAGNFLTRQV